MSSSDSAEKATDGVVVYQIQSEEQWWLNLFTNVITAGISLSGLYLAHLLIRKMFAPIEEAKASVQLTKKALAQRLERPEVVDMDFDDHEIALLNDILGPGELKVTFSDIGGMESQLEEVNDNIVLPMQLWSRYRRAGVLSEAEEALASCPTGMLLYGRPGTGKTLTAKAVAKGTYAIGNEPSVSFSYSF